MNQEKSLIIHKSKLVFYSAIFGSYDFNLHCKSYLPEASYILFTDSDIILPDDRWKVIKTTSWNYEKRLFAKFFKVFPTFFFGSQVKSCWVDGNLELDEKIQRTLLKISDDSSVIICLFPHQTRKSAYKELLYTMITGRSKFSSSCLQLYIL